MERKLRHVSSEAPSAPWKDLLAGGPPTLQHCLLQEAGHLLAEQHPGI